MPIRLVASDIDGTLVDNSGHVSTRTSRVLREASARGVTLAIASGRTRGSMVDVLSQLPPMDYLIQSNGASVLEVKTGRVLYHRPFPPEQIVPVITLLRQTGVAWHAFLDGTAHIDETHAAVYQQMLGTVRAKKFYPTEDFVEQILSQPQKLEKLGVITTNAALRQALMDTLSRNPALRISNATWFNIEINACDATKGNALLALAEYLHIPRAQTAAFGDARNDLSMLEAAGYGVAMGNADDEIKQRARYHTETNQEDGVARFLARQLGISMDEGG